MTRIFTVTAILALTSLPVTAQALDDFPQYAAGRPLFGEIRIWGNEMNVIDQWKNGFHKLHPGVNFWGNQACGTAAGVGAVYTGVADIGFLGRAAVPLELQAFRKCCGYDAFEIAVAAGSFDRDATPGSIIYVNKANPISQLSLNQLDGVFGAQRSGGWSGIEWSGKPARSAAGNLRTWGDLGLTGEWADKPIHVYGYDLSVNGFAFAFQRNVFKGGDSWNPNLIEFPISEPGRPGAPAKAGAKAMMKTLATDPYGIALGAIKYGAQEPSIKPLALAFTEKGPFVAPSRESFQKWQYPLMEPICIYLNRPPGSTLDPKLKEFILYILSRQGQQAIIEDGEYLPLTAETAAEMRERLN